MDHFGIGHGIEGAARIYFQSGRRTGRTTSLVDSLKDGDRVIFSEKREAQRVKRLCLERGVEIEIIVCSPEAPDRLLGRGSSSGDARTLLDHSWVEQFYLNAIKRAGSEIDHFQKTLSGYGEPHRETRRQAVQRMTWDR